MGSDEEKPIGAACGVANEFEPSTSRYLRWCSRWFGWRLARAGFEEEHTLECFDWDAAVTFDRERVKDLFSLGCIERREDVIFPGRVGVGKTFLACALGHAASGSLRSGLVKALRASSASLRPCG